jgi:hypothetical protein
VVSYTPTTSENADRFSHSGMKALEKYEARNPNYPTTWEMKKHFDA